MTHAACRAVHDHPRNLTDDQLRALAGRDGLLGVMLHPLAIDPERRSIDRVIDHIDYAAGLLGEERVFLGGDWTKRLTAVLGDVPVPDGLMPPGLDAGTGIEGLEGPEDYPALVAALRERGWEGERLDGLLSANLVRLLRESLPG